MVEGNCRNFIDGICCLRVGYSGLSKVFYDSPSATLNLKILRIHLYLGLTKTFAFHVSSILGDVQSTSGKF